MHGLKLNHMLLAGTSLAVLTIAVFSSSQMLDLNQGKLKPTNMNTAASNGAPGGSPPPRAVLHARVENATERAASSKAN